MSAVIELLKYFSYRSLKSRKNDLSKSAFVSNVFQDFKEELLNDEEFRKYIDTNHDGVVEYKEFKNFSENMDSSIFDNIREDISNGEFSEMFDANGDGTIDDDEFNNFLKNQGTNLFDELNEEFETNSGLRQIFDENSDGKVDENELQNFLKNLDTDLNGEISFDELIQGINDAVDNKIKKEIVEKEKAKNAAKSYQNQGPIVKTLDNMTLEELTAKKTLEVEKLNTAKDNLNAVYNGTDSVVKQAKDDLEKTEKALNETIANNDKVSDELKKQHSDKQTEVKGFETNISTNKIDIAQKKSEITQKTSDIALKNSVVEGLTEALASYDSVSSDDENYEEIMNRKPAAEAALNAAKADLEQAQKEKEALEEELAVLEETLKQNEDALAIAKGELTEIQNQIIEESQSDEIKNAASEYQKAQTNLDEVTKEQEKKYTEEINDIQKSIDEIDEKINIKEKYKAKREFRADLNDMAKFLEEYANDPEVVAEWEAFPGAYCNLFVRGELENYMMKKYGLTKEQAQHIYMQMGSVKGQFTYNIRQMRETMSSAEFEKWCEEHPLEGYSWVLSNKSTNRWHIGMVLEQYGGSNIKTIEGNTNVNGRSHTVGSHEWSLATKADIDYVVDNYAMIEHLMKLNRYA